ncbi:MAG: hypothetical protein IKQ04_03650 [Oscillospiraceae bacterium]|nr:hypothetical protein [Oscillospiraceae bacterium]
MENNAKIGHPVLGVVLGFLGIAAAILLTFATGVIGGGIAVLLGVIGLILGIKTRKKGGKGMGAIVVGVLCVIIAVILTFTTIAGMAGLRDKAKELKPDSIFAKYAESPYLGAIGIILNMPQDEASMEALQQELQQLQELSTESTEAAPQR